MTQAIGRASEADYGDTFLPASAGRRVVARLIDIAVHLIVLLCVLITTSRFGDVLSPNSIYRVGDSDWYFGLFTESFTLLSAFGYIAYHVVCEGFCGATLGKRIAGIQVAHEDGSPCSPKAALFRSALFSVDVQFFGVVGLMAMHESAFYQRSGDTLAQTVVECTDGNLIQPAPVERFVTVLLLAIVADGALMMAPLLWVVLS